MAAIFGRFSRNCENLLVEAQTLAEQLGRPMRSDVLVLAILNLEGSLAAGVLKSLGIKQDSLIDFVASNGVTMPAKAKEMEQVLEDAIKLAGRFRFAHVEVEHLLFSVAKEPKFSGYAALKSAGAEPPQIVSRLTEWLFSVAMLSQGGNTAEKEDTRTDPKIDLERFVTDLTEAAAAGELDPVVGRDKELNEITHILLRRRKNNPLLVGEPGVGKTALVDALAQQIVSRQVPKALIGTKVLTLDLSLVVAGTMYRGQFEERLKNIIHEVSQMEKAILFIDEVHTLTGTGSSEGGFDAANILKPALARGEITVIGATTHDEYRKHILKDKALDRRFQTVQVGEPSHQEAVLMLKGLKKELEAHHRVKISEEAIRSAVELSTRYIHDRFLPDKAIDVLDQAATRFAEPYVEDKEHLELREEISLVSSQKAEAALQGEYELAKELMEKENHLIKSLQKLEKDRPRVPRSTVGSQEVAAIIQERTGIPAEEILRTLQPLNLTRFKAVLTERILGQSKALDRISQLLMRSQLGLQPAGKPIGSFLLVGPTGVGKTETARAIAQEVFGDAGALVKVDMSEFMERHTVSNLVGAPAGYVGFEQGGSLTESVRRRPYSVVLLDEVEKAHPDIFNILLQILEDGQLTDNTGQVVSFEHCLILMTSNIGMESFNQAARIGFATENADEKQAAEQEQESLQSHIQEEIEDFFRPELLGRLSGILFYNPLDKPTVNKLIAKRFKAMTSAMRKQGITVTADKEVTTWLDEQYNPEAGARSIDRLFLEKVEPVLIAAILEHPEAKKLRITRKDDTIAAIPVTDTDGRGTGEPV